MQLMRLFQPKRGNVFFVMPYGQKLLASGELFDFDELYESVLKGTIEDLGMTPVRADDLYGPTTIMDSVWRGVQEAEIVIVVATGRYPNVSFELALAMTLGKRIVILTEAKEDIPSDLQGERYITYRHEDAPSMIAMMRQLRDTIRERCSEPVSEMMIVPMVGFGTACATATVLSVVRDAVTVETSDGRRGVLGPRDVSWGKVFSDLTKRFKIGDRLEGAFEVDLQGNQRYSLLANKPNPWPELVDRAVPGAILMGVVRNVVDGIGAFVEVAPELTGLVPHFKIRSRVPLQRGMTVQVVVERVDAEERKIDLHLNDGLLDLTEPPTVSRVDISVGDVAEGVIVKVAPEEDNRGGFLLVRVPGLPRPALLHVSNMTEELRDDLRSGDVQVGEALDVRVIEIDLVRGRFHVADIAAEEDVPELAASA